ncbi:HAD family hydrolase [Bdellovibrio bacteriovorus]|uniref:HAD family hydrolase n=1 Tax=Bdellovibrio bacteriovorus TaxID=959 RepID=UPI0035A57DE8
MSQKIKGLLLDIDGTLIDSNDAHAKAWQEALAEFDIHVKYEDVREKIGMGGDNLLPLVAQLHKEEGLGKKVDKRRVEIFKQDYLPHLQPFPYAQQLIELLHKAGLKIIAASSASKEDLGALLKKSGVEKYVDGATSSDDAERSKPAPDIIEAALQKGDLRPSMTLMVGDTPYDIAAAEKAGVQTIAFTCGGWKEKDLQGAVAVLSGPEELFTKLKQIPIEEIPEKLHAMARSAL